MNPKPRSPSTRHSRRIEQAPDTVSTAREAVTQSQNNLTQAESDLARDRSLEARDSSPPKRCRRSKRLRTCTRQRCVPTKPLSIRRSSRSAPMGRCRKDCRRQRFLLREKTPLPLGRKLDKSLPKSRAPRSSRRSTASSSTATSNPGEYPGSRTIFVLQQVDPVYAELTRPAPTCFACSAAPRSR